MSSNPNTKAYSKRIQSLAKAIRWDSRLIWDEGAGRYREASLSDIIKRKDPTATGQMIEMALAEAVADGRRGIRSAESHLATTKEAAATFEADIEAYKRSRRLRLVGSAS